MYDMGRSPNDDLRYNHLYVSQDILYVVTHLLIRSASYISREDLLVHNASNNIHIHGNQNLTIQINHDGWCYFSNVTNINIQMLKYIAICGA